MSPEILGRLGKQDPADILARRKVYIAPLIPYSQGAPDGYEERFKAYWTAVDKQVAALESRAGPVKHVFAEGVSRGGQAGLNALERTNKAAYDVVLARVKAGAVFEPFEDEEIFAQVLDWGRSLQQGFVSRTVANTVQNAFRVASEARQKQLNTRLNEGVRQMEAALLLASRADGVQTPGDMERFIVSPPELDELERWVRQANETILKAMEEEEARAAAEMGIDPHAGHAHGPVAPAGMAAPGRMPPRPGPQRPPGQTPPPPQTPGGLWTPGQQ
jgi:hypothetical protein